MKTLLCAIALSIALPAMAHAAPPPVPAPAPETKCCCRDMDKPMSCCPKHGDEAEHPKAGTDPHASHPMNH